MKHFSVERNFIVKRILAFATPLFALKDFARDTKNLVSNISHINLNNVRKCGKAFGVFLATIALTPVALTCPKFIYEYPYFSEFEKKLQQWVDEPHDPEGCRKKAADALTRAYFSEEKTLNLSSLHLTSLPDVIYQLSNLTELNLAGNQLNTIPNAIGKLTNLTKLKLAGNQLTTISAKIGQLSNLTWLDLSRNKLTTLPDAMGNLINLTRLDLRFNHLTTIPVSMSQLIKVTWLNLSGNKLPTNSICNFSPHES